MKTENLYMKKTSQKYTIYIWNNITQMTIVKLQ